MREGEFRTQNGFGLRELGVIEGPDDPAFDNIVKLAARSIGAPMALLSVADEDRNTVRLRTVFGFVPESRHGGPLPLDQSMTACVIEMGTTLVVADTRLNSRIAQHPYLLKHAARSLLAAPVRCPADQVIGALAVLDHMPRIWTRDQIGMLEAHAYMCGQSILLRAAMRTLAVVARRSVQ